MPKKATKQDWVLTSFKEIKPKIPRNNRGFWIVVRPYVFS